MKRLHIINSIITILAALCIANPLLAQQTNSDRITVPWSDPARPGLLKVTVFEGSIRIKTHSGRDVLIDTRTTRTNQTQPPAETGGLRRIDLAASGLVIEEENNVMTISVPGGSGSSRNVTLEIQAPARTNLNLQVYRGGDIVVDGIEGEIEAQNHHGPVTLNDVAGSVVASSHHGNVTASLRAVTANKPMAFTGFHGNIDVTLPAATKANLKLRSDRGEIYSGFDFPIGRSNSQPTPEELRKQGGKYRLELEKSVTGAINGGGPDIDLRTYHGNLYIRKGK